MNSRKTDYEVSLLKQLTRLTDHFTGSKKGDYPEKIAFEAMKDLDEDLKTYMHLESKSCFHVRPILRAHANVPHSMSQ